MQGQYQPRAPGIAAGQSARATTATYFDYQGVMRIAQPRELRPNFIFQNGVWVQSGYLWEGQATNAPSSFNAPFVSGFHINKETCVDYTDTGGRSGFACVLKGKSEQSTPIQIFGSASQYVNSIYVWCQDFSKFALKPNANSAEYRYLQIDNQNRRYYIFGYFQPFYLNLTEEPLPIRVCGPMAETPNSAATPTSWVPYGQARGAD